MKTTEIMKIEYTEPLMKVKEMRRRSRFVVTFSNDSYIEDDAVDGTQNDW